MDLILHGSDFDPFQVLRLLNGPHIVGDLPKPVFPKGKSLNSFGRKRIQEISADRAIEYFIGVFTVPEEKG